eukprot:4738998-Prymnesium_polylepis.1
MAARCPRRNCRRHLNKAPAHAAGDRQLQKALDRIHVCALEHREASQVVHPCARIDDYADLCSKLAQLCIAQPELLLLQIAPVHLPHWGSNRRLSGHKDQRLRLTCGLGFDPEWRTCTRSICFSADV